MQRLRVLAAVVPTACALSLAAWASGCWLTKSFDVLDCIDCGDAAAPRGSEAAPTDASSGGDGEVGTPAEVALDCSASGAFFCDGFEQGSLNASTWDTSSNTGNVTITVDSEHVRHGSKALHIHTTGGSATGWIMRGTDYPNQTTYTRFFIYVPGGPLKQGSYLNYIAQFTERPNDDTLSLRFNGSSHGIGTGDSRNGDFLDSTSHAIEFDKWQCLELEIRSDGMRVRLEDEDVPDVSTPGVTEQIHQQFFGWATTSGPAAPVDLWIDEIAASTKPIGCKAFQP